MLRNVRSITDTNGLQIDEGIVETVVAMRLLGFNTEMSCAGHEDRSTGGPYVMFTSKEAEDLEKAWRSTADISLKKEIWKQADDEGYRSRYRMHQLLVEFYMKYPANYDNLLILKPIGAATTWVGVVSNRYGDIFEEQKKERLDRSRREMDKFTEFLKLKLSVSSET